MSASTDFFQVFMRKKRLPFTERTTSKCGFLGTLLNVILVFTGKKSCILDSHFEVDQFISTWFRIWYLFLKLFSSSKRGCCSSRGPQSSSNLLCQIFSS